MNYEKMYHLLFNAITDALEQMEKQKPWQRKRPAHHRSAENRRNLHGIRQLTRGERSNAASAGKSRFAQI